MCAEFVSLLDKRQRRAAQRLWQQSNAPAVTRERPATSAAQTSRMIFSRPNVPSLRALVFALVAALIFAVGVASGSGTEARQEPSLQTAGATAVSAKMLVSRKATRALRTCPADLYEEGLLSTREAAPRNFELADCARNRARCYRACIGGNMGEACFRLGQAFEARGRTGDSLRKQTLFALACAGGAGAGCTNRAAGLRNGRYPGGPLLALPRAARLTCEYRSFKIDCDLGGAWGCAMLGQAYRSGEGVARDAGLARQAYKKACSLAPDFEACEFAKSDLSEMGGSEL
jgi:hypothetical protein